MSNVFMFQPPELIDEWANVRDQLHTLDKVKALNNVIQFWSSAPFSKNVIHPQDSDNWPTVWELLNDGDFCFNTIAYCMAMTVAYSEMRFDEIKLLMVDFETEQHFVVEVDGLILNASYGELLEKAQLLNLGKVSYGYKYSPSDRKFKELDGEFQ